MDILDESFKSKGVIVPEDTFGMPTPYIGLQELEVLVTENAIKIGDVSVQYEEIQNAVLRCEKSLFLEDITLTINDGINTCIVKIPNKNIANQLPYEMEEIYVGTRELLTIAMGGKRGVVLFTLIIIMMTIGILDGYLST